MTRELDEQLCAKYPKIFVNRYGDMKTTAMCWGFECSDGWYWLIDRLCSNLQWNTDHNNKDYVIKNPKLRKLIPQLERLIHKIPGKYNIRKKRQWNPLVIFRGFLLGKLYDWRKSLEYVYIESNRYPQIVASQVKEKYGGLRFYVEGASREQYAVISFVETLSNYICERCGSTKNIGHTIGWITTLCEDCKDTTNYIWEKDDDIKDDEEA